MAVITVIGGAAYIGAEVQFAHGSGSDAIMKYGIYATDIDTPTTPRELRLRYGAQWGIPADTRPLLITNADPVNPIYTWLGEDDLVMCGTTVEFMRPFPGRAAALGLPRPQKKKRWWR